MSWEEMQRFVNAIFYKHFNKYTRFKDDLVSCGYLGISKAMKKFDAEKGVKFSTLAYPTVVNEMRHFLFKERKHEINRVDDIDKLIDLVAEEPIERIEINVQLDEIDARIYDLALKGYYEREICLEVGKSQSVVSKRLKRIKRRIKAILECENEQSL